MLTLVATALFIHVISRPQVALILAAQVGCELGREMSYPFSPPPTAVVAGLSTQSLLTQ
jgi:hypothetical protein